MSSNHVQPFPLVPEGEAPSGRGEMEVDGESRLDPDIDPALVDSADADRLASGVDEDDAVGEEPVELR